MKTVRSRASRRFGYRKARQRSKLSYKRKRHEKCACDWCKNDRTFQRTPLEDPYEDDADLDD